jgi:hypothetical protein
MTGEPQPPVYGPPGGLTPPEGAGIPPSAPPGEAPSASAGGTGEQPARTGFSYQGRFIITYTALGVVAAAAIIGLIALTLHSKSSTPKVVWSTWKPTQGSPTDMMSQIADHVAATYRRSKNGPQLTVAVPSAPMIGNGSTEVPVPLVILHTQPGTDLGAEELATTHTEMYTLCGLGNACSISTGKATTARFQLTRREALELALYTFKYVPSIDSVLAFVPPTPPKAKQKTVTTHMLLFTKGSLAQQLTLPLRSTLPFATPPLPTVDDSFEQPKIDPLTQPFKVVSVLAMSPTTAALVLEPG